MDGELRVAASRRLLRLRDRFRNKQYRDGYVAAQARRVLAEQMRNFRGDISQAEFAAKIGKQKTMVARLENPAYGGWTIRTALEVAQNLDVAVFVRFVDFPTFLGYTNDLSDSAVCPEAYNPDAIDQLVADAQHAEFEDALKGLFSEPPEQEAKNTAERARMPPPRPREPNPALIEPSPGNDNSEVQPATPGAASG